ncbi:MAG: hypothetical protein WAM14_01805 [Candidatus Nitrosopolaris sp.]
MIYHNKPAAMRRKRAAKNSADNHNCSTKDVRTISANQLSDIAIKKYLTICISKE